MYVLYVSFHSFQLAFSSTGVGSELQNISYVFSIPLPFLSDLSLDMLGRPNWPGDVPLVLYLQPRLVLSGKLNFVYCFLIDRLIERRTAL